MEDEPGSSLVYLFNTYCEFCHFHPFVNEIYLMLRIVINIICGNNGGVFMNLANFDIGDHGRITGIIHYNDKLKRRMTDMGIEEGAEVSLKGIMPFGGPIMIEVGGHLITIRRKDAKSIEVDF
jgi:ferrous iron transport protein A